VRERPSSRQSEGKKLVQQAANKLNKTFFHPSNDKSFNANFNYRELPANYGSQQSLKAHKFSQN